MSPARWVITCERRLLLTDSRLACEDEGCLTTINLKRAGEGVGLRQIAKHLNLTHGVNHAPSRRSTAQDDCFITDLAWSVSHTAPQGSPPLNQTTVVISALSHLKLTFSPWWSDVLIYLDILSHVATLRPLGFLCDWWPGLHPAEIIPFSLRCCIKGQRTHRPRSVLPPSFCLHLTVLAESIHLQWCQELRYERKTHFGWILVTWNT